MESLGPVLDSTANGSGLAPETLGDLERVRTVLAFVGKRVAGADPLVTLPATLDSIASAFTSAKAELELFQSDNDFGHITSANAHADSAIQTSAQILVPVAAAEITSLSEAAASYRATLARGLQDATGAFENYRTAIGNAREALSKQLEETKTQLGELSANIQAERDRFARTLLEQQEQFSKAQEARSGDFSNSLQNALNQLNTHTTEQINQFSTAQDRRGRDFTDAQTSRQGKFQELVDSYSETLRTQDTESAKQREELHKAHQVELDRLTKEYQQNAGSILAKVEEQKREVEKLVGVIGNLGVTSGYLKNANSARKSLWLWQFVAVAAMAGLIIVAIVVFYPSITGKDGTFSWPSFAGRVFITLTFGALAAYAAKQADNFFEVERRNRRLALELEAIGPYLAPLPLEQQHEFRVRMGDRSFGPDDASGKAQARSPATTVDMLWTLLKSKELQQLIEETVKKLKG